MMIEYEKIRSFYEWFNSLNDGYRFFSREYPKALTLQEKNSLLSKLKSQGCIVKVGNRSHGGLYEKRHDYNFYARFQTAKK